MRLRKLGLMALLLALSACAVDGGPPLVLRDAPPQHDDESAFIQEEYQI